MDLLEPCNRQGWGSIWWVLLGISRKYTVHIESCITHIIPYHYVFSKLVCTIPQLQRRRLATANATKCATKKMHENTRQFQIHQNHSTSVLLMASKAKGPKQPKHGRQRTPLGHAESWADAIAGLPQVHIVLNQIWLDPKSKGGIWRWV